MGSYTERSQMLFRCCISASILLAVATNSGGAIFTHTPTDQEPVEGSSFSVRCSADGAMFMLWHKEDRVIPSNSPHFSQTSSASSITLSVESARHSVHSGTYECVTIYQDSSQDTASFSITVRYIDSDVGIRLAVSGSNCSAGGEEGEEVAAGCEFRLDCDPPDGYPNNISLSWFRNLELLQETARMEISADKRVLTIGRASFDDSGRYQCRASNGIGIIRHSKLVTISVQEAGRGLMFVENDTRGPGSVSEGDLLELSCWVGDVVGRVLFKWLVVEMGEGGEERVAELVEGGRVSISSTAASSTLVLRAVEVGDEGVYCCVASDYVSRIKRNFSVGVKVPRAIVQWPPPQVVGREGERARFDCIASGRPLPVVIWFFQSAPVPSNSGVVDLGNGSILIPSLQPRHAGTYLCMLRDPPLDIHSFSLTVEPSRRAPSVTLLPSPSSSVERLPQNSSHPSSAFTIGPFSEVVSIVVVGVCGLGVLLLSSALLSLACCCWKAHSRKKKRKRERTSEKDVQCSIPAESYLFTSYPGRVGGGTENSVVVRPRGRRLPLPPEPEIEDCGHYEELEEVTVVVTSGVTRPRLPTFASDSSEAAGTELETVISAATDTQLVASS